MARKSKKRNDGLGSLVPPETAGGAWAVRWMEGGKRKYKGGFESKEAADLVLKVVAGERIQGRSILPPSSKGQRTLNLEAEDLLKVRDLTKVAAMEDRNRWKNHLGPAFGHLKPQDVTTSMVRTFIEAKLVDGLNPATIRILVSLLRVLFQRLVDDRKVTVNPVLGLRKDDRALYKPTHDPKTTPFLEKLDQVQAVYVRLPEPLNLAFAIGALAGLRTSEIFGLDWSTVDLQARRIHVVQQASRKKGEGFKRLKDKDSRIVPILDTLLPILEAQKLKSGGKGLVVPSMRVDGHHIAKGTPGPALAAVLEGLKLSRPGLGWYECTRHTFGSHWVMNGGSIEKLKEILGHYSVTMTETHYVHLKPEMFTAKDLGTIPLTLKTGTPKKAGRIPRSDTGT